MLAGFAGSYTDRVVQVGHKDFTIPDLTGTCVFGNCLYDFLDLLVGYDDFDLDFWHEVDRVFRAAVHLGVTALPTKTANLCNGHALNPFLIQRGFDLFQFIMPNKGFDFLHVRNSLKGLLRLLMFSNDNVSCTSAGDGEVGITHRSHLRTVEAFDLGFGTDADGRDQIADLEPCVCHKEAEYGYYSGIN